MKQLLVLAFATLGLSSMSQVKQWEVVVGHSTVDSTVYVTQVSARAIGITDPAMKGVYRQVYKELKDLTDNQLDLLYFDTKQHAARGRLKLEREYGYTKVRVVMLEEIIPKESEPTPATE